MVNVIGESKNVRADNIQAVVEGQRHHVEAIDSQGSTQSEAATGGNACFAGYARTLPKAITPAEKLEERLGIAMLKEALRNPQIPNPEKWRQATAFAQARRAQLTKERRERVKIYAEEGEMTVSQVAELERVVQTTIRADCQVMGVRLKAGVVKVTPYQEDIAARREMLEELAKTGMTRQAASVELGVSEATVRRDIMIMRIKWLGDAAHAAYDELKKTKEKQNDLL
jgi:hypothetical protein